MKEYLSREGVKYVEKNVAADRQAAMEMVRRSQQTGVPVTFIAGETIVGFDQPRLKAAVSRLRQTQSSESTAAKPAPVKLGAKITDALKQGGNMPGALLLEVRPATLAAKAGLKDGDIIIALHDKTITGIDDLARALQQISEAKVERPGLIFLRDGQRMDSRLPVEY